MDAHYIEIGKLSKIGNKDQFEWKLTHITRVTDYHTWYRSPIFSVAGDSFVLALFYKTDIFRFRLVNKKPRGYSVEYSFHLKTLNSSMYQFGSGIMSGSEVCSQTHEYDYPSEDITVTCILRRQMTRPTQLAVLDLTKPLTLISPEKLLKNLKDLFNNKETCDTTLKVKDKEYKAHRAILIAQSPVFAAMFMHDTLEKQTGVVNISDCDPDSFQDFLECLYCGKLEKRSFSSIFHLYVTSNKYEVQELMTFCVEYLKQCLTVENIFEIVVFADKYEETELFSVILSFFKENMTKIFKTSEWECLLKSDCHLANKLLIGMANVKP